MRSRNEDGDLREESKRLSTIETQEDPYAGQPISRSYATPTRRKRGKSQLTSITERQRGEATIQRSLYEGSPGRGSTSSQAIYEQSSLPKITKAKLTLPNKRKNKAAAPSLRDRKHFS